MDEKKAEVTMASSTLTYGQSIEMKGPYNSSSQESTADPNIVLLADPNAVTHGDVNNDAADMARLGKKQEFKVRFRIHAPNGMRETR
jgi:hypothetical protein